MNQIIEKEEINIKDMIYEIRGKQVMLDSDLAYLFKYETKNLNRQVQRNINRFPNNYCFQLTEEEYKFLRCQNVTLKNGRGEHRKYLPYVFSEHGITMLAGILKSDIAVSMSLKIVNTFVDMKRFISSNLIEQKYINNQVMKNTKDIIKNSEDIKLLQKSIDTLSKSKEYDGIFFDGQVYDSYSLLIDIFNTAVNNIIIIDNYIDKKLLDILRNIDKDILIITNKYNNQDYDKYKSQYNNITLKINNNIHDRFIIIDNKVLYHCGASFKDLGKKCFAITTIENKEWLNNLLNYIK